MHSSSSTGMISFFLPVSATAFLNRIIKHINDSSPLDTSGKHLVQNFFWDDHNSSKRT